MREKRHLGKRPLHRTLQDIDDRPADLSAALDAQLKLFRGLASPAEQKLAKRFSRLNSDIKQFNRVFNQAVQVQHYAAGIPIPERNEAQRFEWALIFLYGLGRDWRYS